MNHVYRVVFNRALGVYQCVSELAKTCGKSSGKSATSSHKSALNLTTLSMAMLGVLGLGATVTAQAVTYDNGQTNTPTQSPYYVDNDVVTGAGTVLATSDVYVDNPNPVSSLLISNEGVVNVSGNMLINNDATTTVTTLGKLEVNDAIGIGQDSTGQLDIISDGKVTADIMQLGLGAADSAGSLEVSGVGSNLTVNDLAVGQQAIGNAILKDGGVIKVDNTFIVAANSGSQGTVSIDDGSIIAANLVVGMDGNGEVRLNEGKIDIAGNLNIGQNSDSKGLVIVDGIDSNVFAKTLVVGSLGTGELTFSGGATFDNRNATTTQGVFISNSDKSSSIINVVGSGSQLLTNEILVGAGGNGTLNITENGSVTADRTLRIANESASTGNLNINNGSLISPNLVVGYDGNGHLTTKNASIDAGTLIIGHETGSNGTVILDNKTTLQNKEGIYVGQGGQGSLTLSNESSVNSEGIIVITDLANINTDSNVKTNELIVGTGINNGTLSIESGGKINVDSNTFFGYDSTSTATVTIDGEDSELNSASNILIGSKGMGEITISNGGKLQAVRDLFLAAVEGSKGDLIARGQGSTVSARDVYVGAKGTGTAVVEDGAIIKSSRLLQIGGYAKTASGATTPTGTLTVNNATIESPIILVGGSTGNGTLNLNNSLVRTHGIERFEDSIQSTINFDNATIELTDVPLGGFFNNFNGNNTLNIKQGGLTFDTSDKNTFIFEDTSLPGNGAVLTGVGSLTKTGTGLLGVTQSSKQWTGDTNINQGKIKFFGDYTMRDGEVLGIGLNSLTDYGQLEVNGTADISKGTLNVKASDAVQALKGVNEWKDVVKATTRTGEFASLTDNSLLVTFEADYSDANAVHLSMTSDAEVKAAAEKAAAEKAAAEAAAEKAAAEKAAAEAAAEKAAAEKAAAEAAAEKAAAEKAAAEKAAAEAAAEKAAAEKAAAEAAAEKAAAEAAAEKAAAEKAAAEAAAEKAAAEKAAAEAAAEKAAAEAAAEKAAAEKAAAEKAAAEAAAEKAAAEKAAAEAAAEKAAAEKAAAEAAAEKAAAEAAAEEAAAEKAAAEAAAEKAAAERAAAEAAAEKAAAEKAAAEKAAEKAAAEAAALTTFVEAMAGSNNQSAPSLAIVLDQAISDGVTNGDNALADALIIDTENLSQEQIAEAAAQLQPLFMGGANRLITENNNAVTNAISEHAQTTPERNLWAKALGSNMTHDAEGYVTGYNSDNYGAIVGLDTPINSDVNLGVAVSYLESDADTDGHALNHELKAKNWQVLGYGNYAASDATTVNFHVGAGQSNVEGERHIQILTDSIATSDYDVNTLQAGFGVAHQVGSDSRNITPYASMDYARAESDSYLEKGAGVYNLSVDENSYDSMRWTTGLRFNQALTPSVSLTGQLAGAIENGDDYSSITASFAEVGSDKFKTKGQESKEAIGIAGVGLAFKPTINTTISVNYQGEWRDNYDNQGAALVFETKF